MMDFKLEPDMLPQNRVARVFQDYTFDSEHQARDLLYRATKGLQWLFRQDTGFVKLHWNDFEKHAALILYDLPETTNEQRQCLHESFKRSEQAKPITIHLERALTVMEEKAFNSERLQLLQLLPSNLWNHGKLLDCLVKEMCHQFGGPPDESLNSYEKELAEFFFKHTTALQRDKEVIYKRRLEAILNPDRPSKKRKPSL